MLYPVYIKTRYYPKYGRFYLNNGANWIVYHPSNNLKQWLLHILAQAKQEYLSPYHQVELFDNSHLYTKYDVHFIVSEEYIMESGNTRYTFVNWTEQEVL